MKNIFLSLLFFVPTLALAQNDNFDFARRAFINDSAVQAEVQKQHGTAVTESNLFTLTAALLKYAGGGFSGKADGEVLIVQTICQSASWTTCSSVSAIVKYEFPGFIVPNPVNTAKKVEIVKISAASP